MFSFLPRISGYGLVAKGLKYAYYGHELVSLLVNADMLTALAPVMEGLREFNIKGPNGLLAVYYLACHHDLQRKIDPRLEASGHGPTAPGVAVAPAAPALVADTRRYIAPVPRFLFLSFPAHKLCTPRP